MKIFYLRLLYQLTCCYQSTGCCCDLMVRDTAALSARVRSRRLLVLKHSFYITQRSQRTDRAWSHISHNFVIDMSWLNMATHNSTG